MTPRSVESTASRPRSSDHDVGLLRLPGRIDLLSALQRPGTHAPAVVTVQGWQIAVADPVGSATDLMALSAAAERCGWRGASDSQVPPFRAGAVGYVSHDLAPWVLELGLPSRPGAVAELPRMWFGLYDAAVCLPPDADETWVVAADLPGLSRTDPGARLAAWQERLLARPAPDSPRVPQTAGTARLSLDRPAHARAVGTVLDWIGRGDLYQLNLTLQAGVDWSAGGSALARRLWAASPGAAHAAWLALPNGVEIVSASPETLIRCHGDDVVTRPIKGTRARRPDAPGDRAAAAALLASRKDAAEHIMIVDLERNDLGRVCEVGTVRVAALAELEAHPTVWHLTSTIAGRLRPASRLSDLLTAVFPSGSVTGAPKRMAVARTPDVEPVRRGVYCGSIGVISRGLIDLSVAIRTAVVANGVASYGTGGGIVADSDADEEFEEAMDKAAPFFTATNTAPPR